MGRRHYKRYRVALPVTVSGVDSSGNRFTQSATTVEISARGLRLRGLSCLRGRGDPVLVKYKHGSTHYRVTWIGQDGTSSQGLVGLEGQKDAGLLFADHLPPDFAFHSAPCLDTYVVPSDMTLSVGPSVVECCKPDRRQEERRRHPRHNCAGTAKLWEIGSEHSITGRINEISRGGCYIEIMSPMRTGTAIRLELSVSGRMLRMEGIVRTSQPTIGMGVEFTRMTLAEAERLCRIAAELAGDAPAPTPKAFAEETPPFSAASAGEVGETVLRWFGSHEALTRQELLKLLEQSASAAEALARVSTGGNYGHFDTDPSGAAAGAAPGLSRPED